MISKSTLILLRFPFSYFLLPVFLLSVSLAVNLNQAKAVLVFFIVHFLLYPASNSFNSYYDRDTGSIGAVKRPPRVEKELLPVSLVFDLTAVVLGLFIGWIFATALFLYGIASKVYSFDKTRLKRFPVISWLGTGIVQGFFTFLMICYAVSETSFMSLLKPEILVPALLSSAFLLASYPMTQIYQHDEDMQRGDITISILLGIKGTFIFTAIFFTLVTAGFIIFYLTVFGILYSIIFLAFQLPVLVYFIHWMYGVFNGRSDADYTRTMRLNFISSTSMILFCILFILLKRIIRI